MDEFSNEFPNPFDRFLKSTDLTMLHSALPYVGDSLRKPLALYIKMVEIRRILSDFDKKDVLTACGFETNHPDLPGMLKAMKAAAGNEASPQLDNMLSMLQMIQMYQSCMDLMQKNPELVQILSNMMNQKDGSFSSQEALSRLLPLFMSSKNSSPGTSQENQDMMSVLNELLKKQEV